jgi:dTDP-4-amino-4,6-dideoxygalactose transaminase
MGVGPGDAVVTAPNTFIATTEAITAAGAEVEFVDVRRDTCLMDAEKLDEHLGSRSSSKRVAAVIPVHLYGQCADMDALRTCVSSHGIPLLEDAAQAHGATYRGRPAGSLGDAACFSFYPSKNLGACGEAGAVTTDDARIAERVRMYRDHGQAKKHEHELEGFNSRLDSIQAGFLSVKLKRLPAWNERRRQISARYDEAFKDLPGVSLVSVLPGNASARHHYVILVEERDTWVERLEQCGVATGIYYPTPLHLLPCYERLGYVMGDFPKAEWLASHHLALPVFPEMTDEQVSHVVDSVKSL